MMIQTLAALLLLCAATLAKVCTPNQFQGAIFAKIGQLAQGQTQVISIR